MRSPEAADLEGKVSRDGVVAHRERLDALAGALTSPALLDVWVRAKLVLGERGSVRDALARTESSLGVTDVWARCMARLSFAEEDLGEALRWAEETARRSGARRDAVVVLGAGVELGLPEALPLLRSLVRTESSREALALAAVYLLDAGYPEDAEAACRAALRSDDDPTARMALGVLHLGRGELDAAARELTHAVGAAWDRPEWSVWLAAVQSRLGRVRDALVTALDALDRCGWHHYDLLDAACVGLLALSASEPELERGALQCADQLVQLAEGGGAGARLVDAHARRAHVLAFYGRQDEAEVALAAALALGEIRAELADQLRATGLDAPPRST